MPVKMKTNKYKIIKRCILIIIFTLAIWEGILLYRGAMRLNAPSIKVKDTIRKVQLDNLRKSISLYGTFNLYDLYKQGMPLFRFINPFTQCPANKDKISQSDWGKKHS